MHPVKGLFGAAEIKRITRNISWLMSEKALQLTLGFITIAVTARYLGPEQFGVYSYALSFVMMFVPIVSLGMSGILVHALVSKPEDINTTLGTAFTLQTIAAFICFGLIAVSIHALRGAWDEHAQWTMLAAFLILIKPWEVLDSLFQARLNSKFTSISKIIALAALCTATLAGIFMEWDTNIFVILKVLSLVLVAAGLLFFFFFSKETIRAWRFSGTKAKEFLVASWPLIFSGITAAIYLKIDQIMLGQMVSDSAVGQYAAVAQLSEVWYFLPWIIVSSFFPDLIRTKTHSAEEVTYNQKIQWLYKLLVVLAIILSICVFFISDIVIFLFFGPDYADAGGILRLHIWASIFIFMRAVLSRWLIIENMTIFSLVTHGMGAICNVALNYVLIPEYAGMGAAGATLISYAVASYFSLYLSTKTKPPRRMMEQALLFGIKPWCWRQLFRSTP